MSTDNAKQPVQPGDTFIAYIDDTTRCVGVVIAENDDGRDWRILVLGYFTERSYGENVFAPPFQFNFPGYFEIEKRRVVPYDFQLEINLCKARDSMWWKSLEPPCYTNLVAQFFRPRQVQELQYIDMARQILKGRDIDGFKSFGLWSDTTFLKMWAVLYRHFPNQVKRPPRERDDKNSSNGYHTIDLDCDPPKVVWAIRPMDYVRDGKHLSIY
ncbi:hypothetical protein KC926_03765 [Candidatus Kaiserbacteria bacterium]|nr:hypothetical protein [Candidatus Kaiserbacteria bacterium]